MTLLLLLDPSTSFLSRLQLGLLLFFRLLSGLFFFLENDDRI